MPEAASRSLSAPPSLPAGRRYLVTGGGTGGHVYPAIAIADEIRRQDPTAVFLYVGVRGRSEEKIVPRRGYPLKFVRSAGWPGGRNPVQLAAFAAALLLGTLKSLFIVLGFRPDVIIGTGGYVSAPILLAAIFLRRLGLSRARTFVHESNTFPGRLNRLVGRLVDCVGVSFPETLRHFPGRGVYVGYPVRREVGEVDRAAAREALGIPADLKVVFAFGGSQGARTINRAMVEALPGLLGREDVYVIHGTGAYRGAGYDAVEDTRARLDEAGLSAPHPRVMREPYFHNIEQIYAAADLVVCRAGAGTLTEICARGLPSLILPKAGLPGDHQVKNARSLAARGAARVLYERVDPTTRSDEETLDGGTLAKEILALLDDPDTLGRLGQTARGCYVADALDQIGAVVATLVRGEAPPAAEAPPAQSGPDLEEMTGPGLVGWLTRAWKGGPPPLSPADALYLRYRADRYLASAAWGVRNHGVKLVGLLRYTERRSLLMAMLHDRRPVRGLQRLMGGDLVQVGFIRRNLFDSLVQLDVMDDALVEALKIGLNDGYFEVRSAAARCARHFAPSLGAHTPAVEALLFEHLHDPAFEVQMEVLRALGAVARHDLVDALRPLFFHPNWRVRQALVQALRTQFAAGHLPPDRAQLALHELLISSNGFVPHFPLKAEMRGLAERLTQALPPADGGGTSP